MKSIYIDDLLIDKRNIIILYRVFLFKYRIFIVYTILIIIITWSEIRSKFISNASFAKQEKGGLH